MDNMDNMSNMDNSNNSSNGNTTEDQMVRVVRAAVEYLAKALATTGTQIKQNSLRLEEIKGNSASPDWELTLSYIDSATVNPLASLYGGEDENRRIYKMIKVTMGGNDVEAISIEDRVK